MGVRGERVKASQGRLVGPRQEGKLDLNSCKRDWLVVLREVRVVNLMKWRAQAAMFLLVTPLRQFSFHYT